MIKLRKPHTFSDNIWNDNPSERILRKMGFNNDQEGILRRFLHEQENWDEHLQRSKKYIIDFLDEKKPKKIAVLGSGWLLDVPIEYMNSHCNVIYLIDIRHPRQIKHKYENITEINFVKKDLTGGAIEAVFTILNTSDNPSEDLENLYPPGISHLPDVDCYISVNVLCQLDILILEYIRKFKNITPQSVNAIRQNVQKSHLNSIQKSDFCLITDYKELVYSRTNELTANNPLLFTELPESGYYDEWIWHFDTQMTYYPNRKTYFKVKAIHS